MWDTNSRRDLLIARREERTGVGVDHPNVTQIEGILRRRRGRHIPQAALRIWIPEVGTHLLVVRRRELAVTHAARERGAPVPTVLCLVLWPNLGPLWSSAIGTFEEPDARDLLELLASLPEPADRRRLARHAGAAIRRCACFL